MTEATNLARQRRASTQKQREINKRVTVMQSTVFDVKSQTLEAKN